MDAKLMGDSIASIGKAPEGFFTPSLCEMRAESHADVAELKGDIEKLKVDVQQLRAQSTQEAALGRSEAQQLREETAAKFSQVRSEAPHSRKETAANFAQVRSEATVKFLQVRSEARQLREETATNFTQVRSEMALLRSAMELGSAAIGAEVDVQADLQRLKEQVAALQGTQQPRALESGRS